MRLLLPIVAGLLGLLDLVLAFLYFTTPSGALPTFVPGFEPGGTHIHVTHGIFALIFGVLLIGVAWVSRGSKEA